MRPAKAAWQRRDRAAFKLARGYSSTAHYRTGGLREQVLERDGYKCCKCGMTDEEHKRKWGRPITIDHRNRNRKTNSLENLWTLCLSCHGQKDQLPELRTSRIEPQRKLIEAWRSAGLSCNQIAHRLGVGCRVITKWLKRWNGGVL